MGLMFNYVITNNTANTVGPFDLTAIFGPDKRDADVVFVEPHNSFAFKAELVDPFEHVQYRFAQRINQLGYESHEVQFVQSMIMLPPPSEPRVHPEHSHPPPSNVPTPKEDTATDVSQVPTSPVLP